MAVMRRRMIVGIVRRRVVMMRAAGCQKSTCEKEKFEALSSPHQQHRGVHTRRDPALAEMVTGFL
jgi:hypothetical protein